MSARDRAREELLALYSAADHVAAAAQEALSALERPEPGGAARALEHLVSAGTSVGLVEMYAGCARERLAEVGPESHGARRSS